MRRLAFFLLLGLALLSPFVDVGRPTAAAPPRPDLVVDSSMLATGWTVGLRYFEPGNCALVEGCVDAPGLRRLLVFHTQTGNISRTDLALGNPVGNPLFEFNPCHQHYHLISYADYTLRDPQGLIAAPGHKQSFCLIDVAKYVFESWVSDPPAVDYDCFNQGISAGWSDIYDSATDCQWIDVTGVPPGAYDLSVEVNPARIIHESDDSNNITTAPVTIPDLSGAPDLVVDGASLAASWRMEKKLVTASDPDLAEGCVGGTGYRRLLRFESRAANIAPSDFFLGDPNQSASFVYVPSHGHHHLPGFVDYDLLDASGTSIVRSGLQQGWYPFDFDIFVGAPWVRTGSFYFLSNLQSNLGIQRGWFSRKFATAPCQLIDVTGLPDGPYRLRVTVNPNGEFAEANLANNSAEVPVAVSDPAGAILHRPDGFRIPGAPVGIEPFVPQLQGTASAGEVVTWDAAVCPASEYNLYYSFRPPGSYMYDAAICDIGTSGRAVLSLPDPAPDGLLWFIIAGRDGSREGGHGFDSSGTERPLTAVGRCGISETLSLNACP